MIAPADTLAGRREAALLEVASVRRMAETLAARCRAASWIRTSIASLERFRIMTGTQDLEALLERSLCDVTEAERALQAFARALTRCADAQVAALAIGPKLWFRLNGVAVPWRPLTAGGAPLPLAVADRHAVDRLVLLALIGSGLHLAELLRLQVGDVGSLGPDGRIIPDREADPLAVGYVSRRGRPHEQLTFLSHPARARPSGRCGTSAGAGPTGECRGPTDRTPRWIAGDGGDGGLRAPPQRRLDPDRERGQRRAVSCDRRLLPRLGDAGRTLY